MGRFLTMARALFRRHEPMVFVVALLIVGGVWGVAQLADEVAEGDTQKFDARILLAFRQPGNPDKLVGPPWVESVVRDVTALGGAVVMAMVIAAVAGLLVLTRRYGMLALMLAATVGATLVNTLLKNLMGRPRPEVVKHLTDVTSASFPSGHSAMSAAVYLTLGALLAQSVSRRRVKIYLLTLALAAMVLVGLSRVMLGVHYPSDVLAGWCTGLAWALSCWLVARYLQRRGTIEPEDDALPPAPPPEKTTADERR